MSGRLATGVLAAGLIAALAATAALAEWRTFTFAEMGVGAQFPAPPQITSATTASGASQTTYALDQDGALFRLTVTDFSSHGGDEGNAQKEALAALAAQGQVRLNLSECINGQPGRQLSITASDGGTTKASVFIVGHRLYVLEARLSPAAAADGSADAIRFQQSLRFAGGELGPNDSIQPECRGRAREASEVDP